MLKKKTISPVNEHTKMVESIKLIQNVFWYFKLWYWKNFIINLRSSGLFHIINWVKHTVYITKYIYWTIDHILLKYIIICTYLVKYPIAKPAEDLINKK